MSLYFALLSVKNNKNKKSVKFQGDMLNFYDFIQVFVFTTNHHLKVLAIIYSNSFSHCKGDQKKTVAISQMFSHVQLHVHGMHLLNNRICRYTYSINTTLL